MSTSRHCAVAVDVGGTFIKAALVYDDGSHLASMRIPTEADSGPVKVLRRVRGVVASLRNTMSDRDAEILAVGVALPGCVDEASRTVVTSANLGWRDVAVGDELQAALDLPVYVGHDVACGAIAEQEVGAARGVESFLFVPIGTGIAAAVVVGGRVHRGATNSAGEIGHICVAPDGEQCRCGAIGCLETIASCSALSRRYSRAAGAGALDAEGVIAAAAAGDQLAALLVKQAIESLSTVLAHSIAIVDPELIVIGGGLAGAGDDLIRPLTEELGIKLVSRRVPDLCVTAIGERAGCIGAGLAALRSVRPSGVDRLDAG